MEEREIRLKIEKSFHSVFPGSGSDKIDFKKNRTTYENWDSLAHMQLISEVESAFGVTFEMEEVVGIDTPEDLVVLIAKKLHDAAGKNKNHT